MTNDYVWVVLILGLAGLILWIGYSTGRKASFQSTLKIIRQRQSDLSTIQRASNDVKFKDDMSLIIAELLTLEEALQHGSTVYHSPETK